jgi:D-glycero-D-manno-heptose 1,7-bisphosphate phosphatase
MLKAVFIDKDGTLVKNVPFNVDPLLVSFEKNVIEGLKLFDKHGYKKIIVSNQPGVALGYYSQHELDNVNATINRLLANYKLNIDAFYYCLHDPNGSVKQYSIKCNCRKPLPGLLQKAAKELGINMRESWMLGDILNDVEAGKAACCSTILINNGGESEWLINNRRTPDHIVKDFLQAAKIICKE